MSKVVLDKYTREQAEAYADQEGEIHGFTRESSRWEKAFKEHLAFAYSTMSVGRNPRRNPRGNQITLELYPDVFSKSGFAGRVAEKFKNRPDDETPPFEAVRNRIMSAVSNLSKLVENGILNMKTHTSVRAQGKLDNSEISDLQFPEKKEYASKEEYEKAVSDTVFHWFLEDLITNVTLESLTPLFELTKSDVNEIMAAVKVDGSNARELMVTGRKQFVKRLREQVRPFFKSINYKKLLLK